MERLNHNNNIQYYHNHQEGGGGNTLSQLKQTIKALLDESAFLTVDSRRQVSDSIKKLSQHDCEDLRNYIIEEQSHTSAFCSNHDHIQSVSLLFIQEINTRLEFLEPSELNYFPFQNNQSASQVAENRQLSRSVPCNVSSEAEDQDTLSVKFRALAAHNHRLASQGAENRQFSQSASCNVSSEAENQDTLNAKFRALSLFSNRSLSQQSHIIHVSQLSQFNSINSEHENQVSVASEEVANNRAGSPLASVGRANSHELRRSVFHGGDGAQLNSGANRIVYITASRLSGRISGNNVISQSYNGNQVRQFDDNEIILLSSSIEDKNGPNS